MCLFILSLLIIVAVADQQHEPASSQLPTFKRGTMGPIGIITTKAGAPVEYKEATSTLNTDLLSNEYLMDEMLGLVRERIPERSVHAHGSGAFGYFKVTHDITEYCKADLFSEIGKKTPIAIRFSVGMSSIGVRDTVAEFRGIAVKFYSQEGNFDLTGLNTPVFLFKDPLSFSSLTHAFKRNPATFLPDTNMMMDYLTLHPEGIFSLMYQQSDYNMPVHYRYMAGFPIHTYQVYNKNGVSSYLRFHFIPVSGEKYLNGSEAAQVMAGDPDYYHRGLYNSIAKGDDVSWYLKAQIMTENDRKKADAEGFDIFDVTKTLPLKKYPLHQIGILTLNKNVINNFAQMEQIAFCPGNLVPGICGAPDMIFKSRTLVYRDAQHYRLGGNFKNIPVNCPIRSHVLNYGRDGVPPVNDNGKDAPNYYRNTYNGPVPYIDKNRPELIKIVEKPANNFKQASEFYSNELSFEQKKTLVKNILKILCSCEERLKTRAVKVFTMINKDFGSRIAKGLADCAN